MLDQIFLGILNTMGKHTLYFNGCDLPSPNYAPPEARREPIDAEILALNGFKLWGFLGK